MCKINPRVDFAFKKLFGSEENKDLLISLMDTSGAAPFFTNQDSHCAQLTYSDLTLKAYKFKTAESLDGQGIPRLQKYTVCHSDGSSKGIDIVTVAEVTGLAESVLEALRINKEKTNGTVY